MVTAETSQFWVALIALLPETQLSMSNKTRTSGGFPYLHVM